MGYWPVNSIPCRGVPGQSFLGHGFIISICGLIANISAALFSVSWLSYQHQLSRAPNSNVGILALGEKEPSISRGELSELGSKLR